MLNAVVSVFRSPDLRNKVLFTLGVIALYRFGSFIPTPGVDYGNVQLCQAENSGSNNVFQLVNAFSGGALLQLSIFALGIMPYIMASIISQLLRVLIPRFEALHQEGQDGQAKLNQYTRYIAIGFAGLQAASYITLARTERLLGPCSVPIIPDTSWHKLAIMVLTMTVGAVLLMWLAEQVTERGIGNGMSLLIFVSIAAGFPAAGSSIGSSSNGLQNGIVVLALVLVVIALVVFVEQSQRRIPVQYAKRMVGRKMLGGSSTYIPIKINMAGVIPVIFASSLLTLPYVITQFSGNNPSGLVIWLTNNVANPVAPLNIALYIVLIIFFAYFYTAITFNPTEVADNMKKYGGFVPGIRPGSPTAEYLDYVLSRITFAGAIYLAVVALIPTLTFAALDLSQAIPLGGSSILIVVSVGLDTVKRIQSQLEQRHYEGFLK